MTKTQKRIVVAGVAIAVLMGVFPPVISKYYNFSFLFELRGSIAFSRLLLQWILVGAVTATAVWLKKPEKPAE